MCMCKRHVESVSKTDLCAFARILLVFEASLPLSTLSLTCSALRRLCKEQDHSYRKTKKKQYVPALSYHCMKIVPTHLGYTVEPLSRDTPEMRTPLHFAFYFSLTPEMRTPIVDTFFRPIGPD